jgi:hypothetical protein
LYKFTLLPRQTAGQESPERKLHRHAVWVANGSVGVHDNKLSRVSLFESENGKFERAFRYGRSSSVWGMASYGDNVFVSSGRIENFDKMRYRIEYGSVVDGRFSIKEQMFDQSSMRDKYYDFGDLFSDREDDESHIIGEILETMGMWVDVNFAIDDSIVYAAGAHGDFLVGYNIDGEVSRRIELEKFSGELFKNMPYKADDLLRVNPYHRFTRVDKIDVFGPLVMVYYSIAPYNDYFNSADGLVYVYDQRDQAVHYFAVIDGLMPVGFNSGSDIVFIANCSPLRFITLASGALVDVAD